MAEAHRRASWFIASNIMALIANANRDPKRSPPFSSDDFNPFAERKTKSQVMEVSGKEMIEFLASAWGAKKKGTVKAQGPENSLLTPDPTPLIIEVHHGQQ